MTALETPASLIAIRSSAVISGRSWVAWRNARIASSPTPAFDMRITSSTRVVDAANRGIATRSRNIANAETDLLITTLSFGTATFAPQEGGAGRDTVLLLRRLSQSAAPILKHLAIV